MIQYQPGTPNHNLPDVTINPEALAKCLVNIFPNTPEIALAALQREGTARIAAAIYQVDSGLAILDPKRPTVRKYGERLLNELCKQLVDELGAQRMVNEN